MLSQHIALVPEAGGVNASELARVCAALQKQLTRDFAPVWGITATIDAFPHLEDVPLGYWPIIITFCDLGDLAGVHIDRNGQPYAQVEMSPGWSLHASQACIDMLVNPYGRRLVAGPSPRPDQGPVEFLLEIGAPCLSGECAYVIDEVLVSDFCTPAFWGAMVAAGGGFSFTGALQGPHHVMPGGHLTWHDPISDKWWLRHHLDHTLVDTNLGALDGRTGVVREAMRLRAPQAMRAEKMSVETFEARLGVRRQHALQASQFQAHRLRSVVATDGPSSGRELESGGIIEPRPVKSINGDGPSTARLFAKGSSQARLPRYLEEDVEVEVNQSELLAEDERILANLKEMESAAGVPRRPARETPTSPAPVRSTPPPLPDAPRAPEPQSAAKAATLTQLDAVPAPALAHTQQASTPQAPFRATPLPPPRMPERTYSSSSISPPLTVPPVSMGQVASRPAMNTWILAATLAAAVAISFLGFALYTRATSLPEESGARTASNASPITPMQVAATNAATASTQPVAPAPTAAIIAAPTAAPLAVTPPATTLVATTTPVAATPPAAATATTPPAAPPAPPQPKLVRAKAAAPPAAPRRAAATPADDSDPLEGLIGERR